MIRPRLHEALGYVVQGRLAMDAMITDILLEMQGGYRPTHRGHPWGKPHFDALEGAQVALNCAFDYLKWLQFPEVDSRLREAQARLEQLDSGYGKAGDGRYAHAELAPGDEGGD